MILSTVSFAVLYGYNPSGDSVTGNNITWETVGNFDCVTGDHHGYSDGYWLAQPSGAESNNQDDMISVCINSTHISTRSSQRIPSCAGSLTSLPVSLKCVNGNVFFAWPSFLSSTTRETTYDSTQTISTTTNSKLTPSSTQAFGAFNVQTSTRVTDRFDDPSPTGSESISDSSGDNSAINRNTLIYGSCILTGLLILVVIRRRSVSSSSQRTNEAILSPIYLNKDQLGEDVMYFNPKECLEEATTDEHVYEVPCESQGIENPMYGHK